MICGGQRMTLSSIERDLPGSIFLLASREKIDQGHVHLGLGDCRMLALDGKKDLPCSMTKASTRASLVDMLSYQSKPSRYVQ